MTLTSQVHLITITFINIMSNLIVTNEVIKKPAYSKYELPSEGLYNAVCVDIIDLGERWHHKYAKSHPSVVISFQLNQAGLDGNPLIVDSPIFPKTIHANSGLRQFLEEWQVMDADEDTINLGELLGLNAEMSIIHRPGGGDRRFAYIDYIGPRQSRGRLLKPKNYERSPYWDKMKKKFAMQIEIAKKHY